VSGKQEAEQWAETVRRYGERNGLILVFMEQGQERLGKPGEVPFGNERLVGVGVASALVDGAVDSAGVKSVQERTRSVVDGLAGDGHVVGIHHAVDEAHQHPLRHQGRLGCDDRVEEREIRPFGVRRVRVMAADGMIGQAA